MHRGVAVGADDHRARADEAVPHPDVVDVPAAAVEQVDAVPPGEGPVLLQHPGPVLGRRGEVMVEDHRHPVRVAHWPPDLPLEHPGGQIAAEVVHASGSRRRPPRCRRAATARYPPARARIFSTMFTVRPARVPDGLLMTPPARAAAVAANSRGSVIMPRIAVTPRPPGCPGRSPPRSCPSGPGSCGWRWTG